jgi:hypothetical protein
MSRTKVEDAVKLELAQARELVELVDLEARWENLRSTASAGAATQDLQVNQKAYETFRIKLASYNKRYSPAHVPELLLNTPTRLGIWCGQMRDLFAQAESDPQCPCPVHVLHKAQLRAVRIGARSNKVPVSQPQPSTIHDAIRDLEALRQWCAELTAQAVGPNADASPRCGSKA